MVRKFDVRKVTVKLQTNSVDWDLVDALSWNSHNSPLDQVSNLAASPWKKILHKTEFTPAVFKHYIYTALLILLSQRGPTGLLCDTQHIHHFPEWENWLIQGYLLGESEKAKHPRHKDWQIWPCPPLLVYWGAERPSWERCSQEAQRQPHKAVLPLLP